MCCYCESRRYGSSMACNDEPVSEMVSDPLRSPDRFEAILSSISDGLFTVDSQFRIACFNTAAEQITGYRREEVLGRPCHEVLRSPICRDACPLRFSMETGEPVVGLHVSFQTREGKPIPVSISTAVLHDHEGHLVGGVESFRDLRLVERLQRKIEERYSFEDLVGKSAAMQDLFAVLPTIANGGSNVLIVGESGTGKELVARALHRLGPRADGPFVPVNSGALPDTLIESELFGYRAGAFTGAQRDRSGRIAAAQGGTLFLDEVADLPLSLQVKLLRFLQDKSYEPLGDTVSRIADVNIVAATNRPLRQMLEQGSFRRDLYYRLNVIRVAIPPLRERPEDIPLLVDHFIAELSAVRHKPVTGIDGVALARLLRHDYPGNVRELQNLVEHAFVLCPGGQIREEHLPLDRLAPTPTPAPAPRISLADAERESILAALRDAGWNRTLAAARLGIHKTTLFRKIRKLGIELPRIDGRSHLTPGGTPRLSGSAPEER